MEELNLEPHTILHIEIEIAQFWYDSTKYRPRKPIVVPNSKSLQLHEDVSSRRSEHFVEPDTKPSCTNTSYGYYPDNFLVIFLNISKEIPNSSGRCSNDLLSGSYPPAVRILLFKQASYVLFDIL